MVLLEFAMNPPDRGTGVSAYVARILDVIDRSGIAYRLTPMGTILEGSFDEVMEVVADCFRALEPDCPRIGMNLKMDYRRGAESRLASKVEAVEQRLGASCGPEAKGVSPMPSKSFTNGRIRKADFEPGTKQLELHFDNGSVLAYKHVPDEVFRRLCSAPNPATYWEDRIAEEYPKGTPAKSAGAGKGWGDLFGGNDP